MIEFRNVTKEYEGKLALDNLNLEIKEGEIFGLIGHNGAGKSTTIKSLVSIIDPTSGEIYFDGRSLKENRYECKKKIGYVSDSPNLFLVMTAYEYWSFISEIYEIDDNEREDRIYKYSKIFNMNEYYDQTIESFSHGMRQKTFLIGTLLSETKLWVMDEPMTGLDPQSAFNLKQLMKEHVKEGNSVLFSTHVLEVAENLCDRIGILKKGKLIYCGTVEELKSINDNKSLEETYLSMVSDRSLF